MNDSSSHMRVFCKLKHKTERSAVVITTKERKEDVVTTIGNGCCDGFVAGAGETNVAEVSSEPQTLFLVLVFAAAHTQIFYYIFLFKEESLATEDQNNINPDGFKQTKIHSSTPLVRVLLEK